MPPTSLNVIALISGGKDSLFSLLHCIQNGHTVIALANLYPASTASSNEKGDVRTAEGEDLNSFMYQTVGHTIIPFYAEALGLPLYRRQINGTAVQTGRYYDFAKDHDLDETEDLIPLLKEIKQAHPDADAVSTGAILSTYQRTRVESVALRLGLTPIAYLWQYPALPPPIERDDSVTGLLDDMEAADCDAKLIKIASAGIKESLLGCRVSDPSVSSRLVTGMSRFVEGDEFSLRGAVLGEGGEYETLAVNGPARIWKRSIEIDSTNSTVFEDEGGATRRVLGKPTVVEQPQGPDEENSSLVRVPVLLDDKFSLLAGRVSQAKSSTKAHYEILDSSLWSCPKIHQNTLQTATSITVNNLTDLGYCPSIIDQTLAIIAQLDDLLASTSSSIEHSPRAVFTKILLRHMSDFAAMNIVYGKRFNQVNPPARVTICCGDTLPEGVLLSMSLTLTLLNPERINGLHVQSVSYWAPANIGPYSQAVNVPVSAAEDCPTDIVHLAGQIPLVPSSMSLLGADFSDQAILSLQNLWRVGQCADVDWWAHGIAYLADAEPAKIQERAKLAFEIWKGANAPASTLHGENEDNDDSENDDHLDAWDLRYNHQLPRQHSSRAAKRRPRNSHLHMLPNHGVLSRSASSSQEVLAATVPPFLAVHVSSLPRSAPIEWHSLGLAHLPKYPASKLRVTVSTKTDDYPLTSTSTCRLERSESLHSGAGSDEEEEQKPPSQRASPGGVELQFFSIQVFTPPPSSAPPSSSPNFLTTVLHSALSSLSPNSNTPNNPPPPISNPAFVDLTIFLPSQRAYEAVKALGLGNQGTVVPCWSLWGEGGRRVEVAVLGCGRSWDGGHDSQRTKSGIDDDDDDDDDDDC